MDIIYHGYSCFSLKSKTARVVCDPFDPKQLGLSLTKLEADIVTVSHSLVGHSALKQIAGDPLVIDWPGEFEKNKIKVSGFSTCHDELENIIFKMEIDDISLLHCGNLSEKLTNEIIDRVGNVDVLILPVGYHNAIDDNEAIRIVKQFDPSLIIPMYHQDVHNVDGFVQKIGLTPEQIDKKITIKKEELTEVVRLAIFDF